LGLEDYIGENKDIEKVYGIYIGIVKENYDKEKLGRVRVEYPWRNEIDKTAWARVLSPMAGNKRGFYFIPEIGDEVLVAFEEGNVNKPYIIGSLWNGEDEPPELNNDNKNYIKKVKTKGGHELIFDDSEKNGKIQIKTRSGQTVLIDDSTGSENIEIKDNGGNMIKLNSKPPSVSIESGGSLMIKANMIEIEAKTNMKLKAGAIMTVEGAMVKIN
jgi:uncharacterized protein involved in type VI secretion and phage assembly